METTKEIVTCRYHGDNGRVLCDFGTGGTFVEFHSFKLQHMLQLTSQSKGHKYLLIRV